MRARSFGDFMNKKKRESVRQLGLVKQLLEKQGLKAENFTDNDDNDDPYIFCANPAKSGSFDGVRIYKVGDQLAFRIQKEKKTHPYGAAYPLPIEEMFADFLTDEDVDEMKAGSKVIETVSREIRRFFDKSAEAERKEKEKDGDKDSMGSIMNRTGGTDYSAQVFSKG